MLRFSVCVVCETLINKEWLVNPQPFFKVNYFITNATNVFFFFLRMTVSQVMFLKFHWPKSPVIFIVDSLAVLQATFGDSLQRQDQERRHGGDFFLSLNLGTKTFFQERISFN